MVVVAPVAVPVAVVAPRRVRIGSGRGGRGLGRLGRSGEAAGERRGGGAGPRAAAASRTG